MERILQSFKDLYKGEQPFKAHLVFILLLLIPSLLSGIANYIDKDTPKEILIILGIIGAVVGLLSIIPIIFLSGYSIDFCQNRLNSGVGFPKFNKELFFKGAKVIPLGLVWGIYSLVFFGVLFCTPLILLTINAITINNNPSGFLLFIVGFIFIVLLCCILTFLIYPFCSYIMITYAKNEQYSARLFNPLIIIEFMKKSFKSSILVALKFILVAMVVGIVSTPIYIIFVVFYLVILAAISMISPTITMDNVMYAPLTLSIVIPLFMLAGVFQMYIQSIIGYAQLDNYIEIFKKEIDIQE